MARGTVHRDETQYAYAVGRIRVVEKTLLDRGKINRMVDARSSDEALKVIIDSGYGYSSGERLGVFEYEKLLKEEQQKVYRLLRELSPEPEIFDMFLFQSDYHNIKVMLKNEFLGREDESILVDTGIFAVSKLKLMIKERKMAEMPEIMRKAVEECIDTFNRTGNPQIIDLILDRANFLSMAVTAEKINNDFLTDLVNIMIDLINIKIFLRIKNIGNTWDFLDKVLLPYGFIDKKVYIEKFDQPFESFTDYLRYKPYGDACEKGIESYLATGSLTKYEKLSDDYIINYLKKSKFVALGVEPLIGYLIAKEYEIKNVRIIMVGKINNIPSDIIRERLRETYV